MLIVEETILLRKKGYGTNKEKFSYKLRGDFDSLL